MDETQEKYGIWVTSTVPVSLSNCSPNEITGIADAKNIYVVGANILRNNGLSSKLHSIKIRSMK